MGVELKRRAQLVNAAIVEIGETGSLDVTVGRIARRAGVSPALAFHYFGDKEHLFLAAMRHVLRVYGAQVRSAVADARTPRARLEALIAASFSPPNFHPGVIASWLNFYVLAYRSDEARRLLRVYHRRLRSNLVHDLRPLAGARAGEVAERIGALIDGLYLRSARAATGDSVDDAVSHVLAALDRELGVHA